MNSHDIIFTLRLDTQTRDELDKLSNRWRCSRAETLRRLVRNCSEHVFTGTPLCADGGRCFVPQMHVKQAAV